MFTSSADEREIYRNIVRFARAMDERDWSAIEDIAAVDATAQMGGGPMVGRDAIVALMRSFLDECGPTQHLIGNVLIDIDADGETASSRAYVSDMHLGTGELAQSSFRTLGDYHDEWAKIDGRWWLTHRTKHNHASLGSFEVLGPGPAGWRPGES